MQIFFAVAVNFYSLQLKIVGKLFECFFRVPPIYVLDISFSIPHWACLEVFAYLEISVYVSLVVSQMCNSLA